MGIMLSPETLRRIPLFSGLDDDMTKSLAMIGERCGVQKGTCLFREGDSADAFYVLLEGQVELRVTLSPQSASKVCVTRLGPGEIFGWSALVEPYVYHLSAVATQDALCARFDGPNLCELLAHYPGIGYKLMCRVTQVIGDRLQNLRIQFVSMIEGGRWQDFAGISRIYISEGGKARPSQ
jgi:CRP-like cAMP-binding protein